ncbi:MAG: complex I NDUFA9 subunit family protein [Bacillota bacterium]
MEINDVCVLGGTGFVGQSLAEHLCERGARVRVVTRGLPRSRSLWVLPTLEVVIADPQDEVALAAQFEGMDAVINLCGILHETSRQTFESVHVDLPRKAVGACRAAGVRHFVHMSALGASETGPSAYLRSKGRGEAAVREAAAGLPVTIVRPSVIFGEEDDFLNKIAGLLRIFPVLPLAVADARFQPVWVEDVARVMATLLGDSQAFGQSYELCGPKVYRFREIVELVAREMGVRRAIVALPGWAGELQAFALEHLPGKMMTRDNLRSLSVDNVCDSPFPALFGFQPASVEAIAPEYLAGSNPRARYNLFRYRAGR